LRNKKSILFGNINTFTGFGDEKPKRIDFLFLNKEQWQVSGYGVLSNIFEDGIYISDHRAAIGDIAF